MVRDFEDVKILDEAGILADSLWNEIIKWPDFPRSTVGKQLVRAADSIGANIAEAYGRFHFGEKIQFLYYARGSLFESKNWINRSVNRQLLPTEKAESYASDLSNIAKQLNGFVRHLRQQRKQSSSKALNEPSSPYLTRTDQSISLFTQKELDWLANSQTTETL